METGLFSGLLAFFATDDRSNAERWVAHGGQLAESARAKGVNFWFAESFERALRDDLVNITSSQHERRVMVLMPEWVKASVDSGRRLNFGLYVVHPERLHSNLVALWYEQASRNPLPKQRQQPAASSFSASESDPADSVGLAAQQDRRSRKRRAPDPEAGEEDLLASDGELVEPAAVATEPIAQGHRPAAAAAAVRPPPPSPVHSIDADDGEEKEAPVPEEEQEKEEEEAEEEEQDEVGPMLQDDGEELPQSQEERAEPKEREPPVQSEPQPSPQKRRRLQPPAPEAMDLTPPSTPIRVQRPVANVRSVADYASLFMRCVLATSATSLVPAKPPRK